MQYSQSLQTMPTMLPQSQRILIYTTCYNVLDGVTLTIRKIEEVLLEAGHHVCILTTKSGNLKNTHMDGEHPNRRVIFIDDAIPLAHSIDPHNNDNTYYIGFALSSHVISDIEQFEPTLIHITAPDCTCLHLIEYARKRELPLMGTYHSNIPDYMKHYPGLGWVKYILEAFFRHEYNFLQALYVPTPFIRRQLTQTLKMDKATNLGVWGRGIDLQRFSPRHRSQEFRQKMGFSDDDVVLLWVGRLVPEKRPDIFVEVVRRLNAKNIPFKALVVGAGPSEDAVKALPNTTFAGWMSGDELALAYASSDVFLFPSAVETFGNVSLEAAASGLPIVVEEGCGGHLVKHGISGFACEQHDVDAFFNSVRCLVLDEQRRKSMAKEGRKLSLQFEKKVVCERMLENYATVTNEFYTEYGGLHANRDIAYQKEDSFVSGNTPRPIPLILVESLFILLLRVYHRMTVLFMFLREKVILVPHAETTSTKPKQVVVVKTEDQARRDSLKLLQDIADEEMACATLDSEISMALHTVKEDDDTDSTSSSGTESHLQQQVDLHISHKVSMLFVKLLYFSMRSESRIRYEMARCFRNRSQWVPKNRKRKNTQDTFDLGLDSSSSTLHMAREDKLNLRRSNSTVIMA